MSTSSNNKRIAKNTLLLYFRMGITMAVALFTSRVVLNTLGVEDYGVYNVVGGVVAMFGFINAAMSSATSRYITFALGRGDEGELRKVFCTSVNIHAGIALIILLLAETVGLWYMNCKMVIPPGREAAAMWVYQLSVVSTMMMIVSVPYNSCIIAHERMSAFAYMSILDVVLKLLVVYLLVVSPMDKLVFYSMLILIVQFIDWFIYIRYCVSKFSEAHYHFVWDKSLTREMTSFAGWSLFGNLSAVAFTTGLNLLLNLFFGPVVNAARAVAVQVQNAIQQFVGNFQMALNPQITKTYAQGEMEQMHTLMFRSARFSFFLLFFLSLPVLFETEYILTIWLKTVPEHTVTFLRIMICTSLIYTCANPMINANQATGKVKKYQIVCGSTLIMILPISWLFLELGFPAYSVFIVHFVMECLCQLARMIMLRPLIGIRLRDYFINIYFRISIVVAVAVIMPGFVFFSISEGLLRFLAVGFVCVLSVISSAYFFGMSNGERVFIRSKIISFKKRYNNK